MTSQAAAFSTDATSGANPLSSPSSPITGDAAEVLVLDGSQGEGGGQIIRNAISYAALLQKHLIINNIRAGKPKPGLRPQHVASLQLVAELCGGSLTGASVGSTTIQYTPTSLSTPSTNALQESQQMIHQQKSLFRGSIGTAGSIFLLLQAALPCALFRAATFCADMTAVNNNNNKSAYKESPSSTLMLVLQGGTTTSMAPQYEYWQLVFLPMLSRLFFHNQLHDHDDQSFLSASSPSSSSSTFSPTSTTSTTRTCPLVHARVIKRGYFPKGGGEVVVHVVPPPTTTTSGHTSALSPSPLFCLPPISLQDPGTLERIYIRSFHAGQLPRHLAQDMAHSAKSWLMSSLSSSSGTGINNRSSTIDWKVDIVTESNAVGSGCGILIVGRTSTGCLLAGSALGEDDHRDDDNGQGGRRRRQQQGRGGGGSGRIPRRHIDAKAVGIRAAQELYQAVVEDGGCVDEWLQDQLILYMALAQGTSTLLVGSLTLHTQTAILVAEQVAGAKFVIERIESTRTVTTTTNTNTQDDDDNNSVDNSGGANKKLKPKDKVLHDHHQQRLQDADSEKSSGTKSDDTYGCKGRISGKHLIRCHGIGFQASC